MYIFHKTMNWWDSPESPPKKELVNEQLEATDN